MSDHRKPMAFRIEPERPAQAEAKPRAERARKPLAAPAAQARVEPDPVDVFDAETIEALAPPPPAVPVRRRSGWGTVLAGALGLLLSLAVGLWTDRLIRDLFDRADWLGWFAVGLAGAAALALVVILAREALALARLASVARMQQRAAAVAATGDAKAARRLAEEMVTFLAAKPETAAGRRVLADLHGEVIDGPDLLRLTETELLAPLDARARTAILNAAKRVSIVTAVSPRALVDVAYVLFESGRLVRRLAEIYGGRPGTLGFFRLARNVLAHLAVTGSMAAGDSLVQQLIGHGLAARLSARLGEGVVNGMMTARIGIAAMETTRPLPFAALRRPGLSDFLSELARFSAAETETPKNK
ncbi:MAG: TIGR01620 family protein [Rhizobiaceae bacterium]|nr:TIGR01620 family protein [Rhizobiaceae bacterium]MCV0407043.1 TIGR01620 family protein [Rhizobiaceae bacterium]